MGGTVQMRVFAQGRMFVEVEGTARAARRLLSLLL
jgi:hypothetical protein